MVAMRYAATMLLVGCGHSAPFAGPGSRADGAFDQAPPMRLTYSLLGDFAPAFSQDGSAITYMYERATPDHDRCLGVLGSTGGPRHADLCAWHLGEADSADALESGALRADGQIAFTMYTGLIGNPTSKRMGLYLGTVDSIAGSRLILPLGQRPPGASATWSELVSPTWLNDDEMLVLAARRHLVNSNGCGTPAEHARDCDRTPTRDTIPVGIEFARLRIDPAGATVVGTIPATDAIDWSLDRDNGLIHYIVQRPRLDLADVFHESLADSVYAVPMGGGTPTLRYGTAGGDGPPLERLHGIASGHGRLFISRSWRANDVSPVIVPPGAPLFSDISEVLPDGSLRLVAPAISWRWGRIRLSPDGRWLVAEALERTTSDLYLIEVAP